MMFFLSTANSTTNTSRKYCLQIYMWYCWQASNLKPECYAAVCIAFLMFSMLNNVLTQYNVTCGCRRMQFPSLLTQRQNESYSHL